MKNIVVEKLKEALLSVLPLTAIVLICHFVLAIFVPSGGMPLGTVLQFVIAAVLLIVGMTLFSLGADISMSPMGERIGAHITRSGKYYILIPCCFLIGMLITIAEPDLTVLATQFPAIDDMTIILTVSIGVGVFLVVSFLRVLKGVSLSLLLAVFYLLLFVIASFAPDTFVAVAFDSGGVTTGPITVPFLMAMGIGLATVRGGKSSTDDSFGTVALCSVGPIIAMLILGIFCNVDGQSAEETVTVVATGADVVLDFIRSLPHYLVEVALALLPIVGLFILFQFIFLHLPWKSLARIGVGILYTYIGLSLFLLGANVGFLPAGQFLGRTMAGLNEWLLIPIGMIMGFFVVMAEPAVRVLNRQVEELTVGAITKRAMLLMLSIGVAIAVGLAMLRVVLGISIWYFLVIGYSAAIILSFFVPKVFTAIAFDSGGVASGPMTATFMLPFAMGACAELGGNLLTDAFGLVAFVAMTPLITIQILGLSYSIKIKRAMLHSYAEQDTVAIIEFEYKEAV